LLLVFVRGPSWKDVFGNLHSCESIRLGVGDHVNYDIGREVPKALYCVAQAISISENTRDRRGKIALCLAPMEDRDRVACFNQQAHNIGAEKASAAEEKNSHCYLLSHPTPRPDQSGGFPKNRP